MKRSSEISDGLFTLGQIKKLAVTFKYGKLLIYGKTGISLLL